VVASFGERLKLEREKRGMTLEEVSGVTKISVRNLRALEQERFEEMPGGIFNRGFVRSYAKHLGLDDEQVIADYLEAAGEAPAETEPASDVQNAGQLPVPPGTRESDPWKQVPWRAFAALVIVGTLILALWSYRAHRHTAAALAPTGSSGPSSATNPLAHPTDSAASGTPQSGSAQPSSPASREVASGAGAGPATASPAGFDISLHARDEVWLSSAIDGQPPSEVTLVKGQSIVVHGTQGAILRLGNAAVVDVAFNGQPVPLHASAGQVRTLTFAASGLQAAVVKEGGQN